ncbi:MAG TPA: translation elongation factor Ts [Planctomycetaceae bacterium]|nr:translation elongation factor Ts [Planctomycetaceae bacterium]
MAEITAADVKRLRDLTDLPMMECKKALMEAGGDQQRAIDILREGFKKVQLKRQDNVTSEGRIFARVQADGSRGAMVEIQCESAPVATGQVFGEFGALLVTQLLEGPGAATPEELMAQSGAGGRTLNDRFEDLVNKIREKIVLARVARVEGPVGAYIHHDGKTGVLFQATGQKATAPVLRDVAMHIAALRPTVTTPEQLDPALVQKERDRLAAEARATGKPENIIEKIVDGRMKTFYVDSGALVVQPFAKDDTKTVSQALAEHGLQAKSFILWRLGN